MDICLVSPDEDGIKRHDTYKYVSKELILVALYLFCPDYPCGPLRISS